MMKSTLAQPLVCAAFLLSFNGLVESLFIPEELPTLLSFLYTNIPPIFKGTDSRLGVGFRVGPNADFQLQFEVGPQTRTKALGPDAAQGGDEGSSKKRHAPKLSLDPDTGGFRLNAPLDTPQGWLRTWKDSVNTVLQEPEEEKPSKQVVMDYDTVRHLQQLYKEQLSTPSDHVNDELKIGDR